MQSWPFWMARLADLNAGTSTGGLLALVWPRVASGIMRNIYETKGAEIFDDSWLDNLVDLGKIAGPISTSRI